MAKRFRNLNADDGTIARRGLGADRFSENQRDRSARESGPASATSVEIKVRGYPPVCAIALCCLKWCTSRTPDKLAVSVSLRSYQTGLRVPIPNALSTPIVFFSGCRSGPLTRLEFCHSGHGRVDVELREPLGYVFRKRDFGVVIHFLCHGRFCRFWGASVLETGDGALGPVVRAGTSRRRCDALHRASRPFGRVPLATG